MQIFENGKRRPKLFVEFCAINLKNQGEKFIHSTLKLKAEAQTIYRKPRRKVTKLESN